MTILGAIADDFTGATDLAALIARAGVRVRLHTGLPHEEPTDAAPFEVIALKTRTAPVATARAEALAALDWLRRAGAGRIFFKYCSTFDSTPEGNIGPVAEALMDALGAGHTIYCPAFPENGRTVYCGNLFVGRQPLAESPMKHHPLTPMRDSDLTRLLSPQVTRPVGLLERRQVRTGAATMRATLAAMAGEGVAHVVVDAVENDDLAIIAEACRDMTLVTGGSAVAMYLPAALGATGAASAGAGRPAMPTLDERAIVLSGSSSAMTNRQVADYLARGVPSYRLDPRALVADGPGPMLAWLAAQRFEAAPLVYATAEPAAVREAQQAIGVEAAGELVESALSKAAVAARDAGARRFVVAGGETSGAITRALGVTTMEIGPEIAPGVPWCACVSAGVPIALTLKSGNFGAPTFFSDALSLLQPA